MNRPELKTVLIAYTPDPVKTVASAARLCYSPDDPQSVLTAVDNQLSDPEKYYKVTDLLRDICNSGHMSPFEHVSYTFGVSGLSRVASHQLVRHRIATYSQQSQRYVSQTVSSCIMPPSIAVNNEAAELFAQQVSSAWETYDKLLKLGMTGEDARFILPHGAETKIIFTMNARELLHFFNLRLCNRAQWEIRNLARQMLSLVLDTAPEIFISAGPACMHSGCTEPAKRSCRAHYGKPRDAADLRKILQLK